VVVLRKTNPTRPIHITLPMRLIEDMDASTSNRSRFIAAAIEAKLHGSTAIEDAPDIQILTVLMNRGVIDYATWTMLKPKCRKPE
jgi:metal-responsive CopG/Arc/MetJ family transcriptional regulator